MRQHILLGDAPMLTRAANVIKIESMLRHHAAYDGAHASAVFLSRGRWGGGLLNRSHDWRALIAQFSQQCADFDFVALARSDLRNLPRLFSDDFSRDLVSLDLDQHIMQFDRVADFLVPACDGHFIHTVTEIWQFDLDHKCALVVSF
jgi:hypothetical protein